MISNITGSVVHCLALCFEHYNGAEESIIMILIKKTPKRTRECLSMYLEKNCLGRKNVLTRSAIRELVPFDAFRFMKSSLGLEIFCVTSYPCYCRSSCEEHFCSGSWVICSKIVSNFWMIC